MAERQNTRGQAELPPVIRRIAQGHQSKQSPPHGCTRQIGALGNVGQRHMFAARPERADDPQTPRKGLDKRGILTRINDD